MLLLFSQCTTGFAVAVVTRRLNGLFVFELSTAWTLLVVAIITYSACNRPIRRTLAIRSPGWMSLAVVLLLTTPLVLVADEAIAWLVDDLRRAGAPESFVEMATFTNAVGEIRQSPPFAGVLLTVTFFGLLPAVGEELFFRGFLGRGLVARWGSVWGVLLTTLLFAVVHIHPIQVAGAAIFGVVLHVVYLWTRSLAAPVLVHGLCNCQIVLLHVLAQGSQAERVGDEHLPPVLALTALAAVIGLMSILYQSRVRWVKADGSEWYPGFPSAETPPTDVGACPTRRRPGSVRVAAIAVVYLLFATALGWELSRG